MAAMVYLLCCSLLTTERFQEYLEMVHTYSSSIGLTGDATKGEIELLKDPEKAAVASEKTGRDIGIVYQDSYWIWINDPVQFPSGSLGVYGRILPRSSLRGFAGCAVIPRFRDGRIALICQFRHATRSWELEIPRGSSAKGETPEETARRELLEETGLTAKALMLLGEMVPDTGQSSALVPVFMANIEDQRDAKPDESEAIASTLLFTVEELCEGLRRGSVLVEVHGEKRTAFLRDPFLTYALVQMQTRGFLNL